MFRLLSMITRGGSNLIKKVPCHSIERLIAQLVTDGHQFYESWSTESPVPAQGVWATCLAIVGHNTVVLVQCYSQKVKLFQCHPPKCAVDSNFMCVHKMRALVINLFDCYPQTSVLFLSHPQKTRIVLVYLQKGVSLKPHPQKTRKGLGQPIYATSEIKPY